MLRNIPNLMQCRMQFIVTLLAYTIVKHIVSASCNHLVMICGIYMYFVLVIRIPNIR